MRFFTVAAALVSFASVALGQDQAVRALSQASGSVESAKRVFDGDKNGGVVAAPVQGADASRPSPLLPAAPSPAPQAPAADLDFSKPFSDGFVGLYPQGDFTLTTGHRCADCNAPKEGLWYFEDEVIAVPKTGQAGIVWIGSTQMLEHVTLSADGQSIRLTDGAVVPFKLTPKIQSNRSFYNQSTVDYFQNRPLRVRGEWAVKDGVKTFVARTIWPEDQRVDISHLKTADVKSAKDIDALVTKDDGGPKDPYSATLLWKNGEDAASWSGKPVMGLMLNGGQGDDDESQGGHFSLFTGRMGPNGEMADWMFDNFYDMDQYSEKGIIAGMVPMDKYMADVNSGQSYYRPTQMIVAVMKDDALARKVQDDFKTRYQQYYAHQIKYDHTHNACTSLIVDVLRADGWDYPLAGPSPGLSRFSLSMLAGVFSLSPKKYADVNDALSQERTHLFPRAAFDSLSGDMIGMADGSVKRQLTPFEEQLKDGLVALVLVQLPQFPSSRAFGQFPVADGVEYFHRAPLLPSNWKTVPTLPRSFPPPH